VKLGEKIAITRRDKGISQVFIANKLGKTSAWLSNIEKCRRDIGAKELGQVAEILGVDIGIFFNDKFNSKLSVELNSTGSDGPLGQ